MQRLGGILLIFAMMLNLSSCGGESPADPLEAVPDGARTIAVMNLEKISMANGANNLVTPPDGLSHQAEEAMGLFIPADIMRPLAAVISSGYPSGVETTQTVVFTASNGYTGLILKVTDRNKIAGGTLSEFREASMDFGDYDIYTVGRRIIALADHLCIIAPDMATIKTIGSKTTSTPISHIESIRQFLISSDNDINIVRRASDLFGKQMNDLWLCGSLRFTDHSIIARISTMSHDGQPDRIGNRIAEEIDPAIAGFIPQGSSIVIASGKPSESPRLLNLERMIGKYLPGDISLSTEGTTAWYARPAGSLNDDNLMSPDVWNLANIIQMPAKDGDRAVSDMLAKTNGKARLDPDSQCHTITQEDATLTFGYINGFFVRGMNGPVSYGNSNTFASDFQAARLAAVIDIPLGSALQKATGLSCGATLSLKATDEIIKVNLTFHGSQLPVLTTISELPMARGLLPYILTSR